MRKRVIILGLVLLLLAGIIGWQVVACYVANSELQSDMKDLAVQNRFRIGMTSLPTEDELRDSVIANAKEYGIELKPQQVTVHETVSGKDLSISIAADYKAHEITVGQTFAAATTATSTPAPPETQAHRP